METIARTIHQRRKDLRLSKTFVSKTAGITIQSLWNIERGKPCSVQSLLAVCRVLDLQIELKCIRIKNILL